LKRIVDCMEKLAAPSSQDVHKAIDERLQAHQAPVTASVQQILGNFLSEIIDGIHENRKLSFCAG
jgi:hypothetical protein